MSNQTSTVTTSSNGNGTQPAGWKEYIQAAPDLPEQAIKAMIHAGSQVMLEVLASDPGSEPAPAFKRYSIFDYLKKPKKPWLLRGYLGQADLAMVYGEAGSGKTFYALALAIEAARGATHAGQFEPTRPLKIAYCAGEGQGGLVNRFTAALNACQGWTGQAQELLSQNFSIFDNAPQLYDSEVEQTIYRFVEEWQQAGQPLDVLIIDTLHAASFGSDENNARDAGLIIKAARYAIEALGCAVVLVHHANRSGKYRGSSAFHGAMDSMVEVKKDDINGVNVVECFKLKDAEQFKPLYFKLVHDPAADSAAVQWLDRDTIQLNESAPKKSKKDIAKDDIIALLRQYPAMTQTQIIEHITNAGRNSTIEALKELEQAGAVTVLPGEKKNEKIYQLNLFD